MSAFDSNDPFDNGQQWQSVQTSSATRSWGEAQQEGSQVLRAPQQTTTTTTTTTSSSSRIGSNTQDGEGGGRRVVSSTSSTTSEPTAHESSSSKKSHGHNLVQSLFHSHSKAQTQEQTQGKASSDEQPPSYEASSIDSRPQLHDNYDHLRGPPGQRGVDVKTRIPLESEESGGAGAGSSSQAAAGAGVATAAGVASYGAAHGRSPSSGQQPQGSLRGQRAIGPDQDDEAHARDTDRLLGPNHHDHHHSDSESESDCSDSDAEHGRANGARRKRDDPSHWSVVGKRQAWLSLLYTVLVLVPWAGFCFAWTVLTMLLCILSMLIPPCGYVIVVISGPVRAMTTIIPPANANQSGVEDPVT
ncbi:hypothetical protein BGW38_005807 [Lunasporangiospora selenospora]|uniref:Uncharacterized protein n=1 Tax=Lunasporangiospora selenospora TaxID=979761 RepID=A0A9P6G0K5_9FUNG|nr:hypothetical protein BGW38_005807 [Lunasporangiospora selenospora]